MCSVAESLLAVFSEIIKSEMKNKPGIKDEGYNAINIRYANDAVLITDYAKSLLATTVGHYSNRLCKNYCSRVCKKSLF